MHCFCVCSDIALLGALGVNRNVERDFFFVYTVDLSKDFLDLLGISCCVKYSFLCMFICVNWFEFDLVVSICQEIKYKDFSEDACLYRELSGKCSSSLWHQLHVILIL